MFTFEEVQHLVGTWGTVYFGLIFLAALAYALAPSKKSTFEHAASIPLRED